MCHVCITEGVRADVTRRAMMAGAATAAASGLVLTPSRVMAQSEDPVSFNRAVDLTHRLTPDFPTYFGTPAFTAEDTFTWDENKVNLKTLTYPEHVGTHFDAPIHFSENGATVDEIAVEHLVCPLAVIDVRAAVTEDTDYRLTPDDIRRFEAEHGDIPQGACVAMLSGWADHVATDQFRGADTDGALHFPGFHVEAADFLMREREVKGIGVDTLSLDHGPSTDSPVHYAWLPSGRWGVECLAGLAGLPALGATLVAGAPRFAGGTGGPGRAIALV
ncbi:cyclase family protein [Sulfitobacter sp. M22]|jgi:kynurenine formamidase|nr:cyclase family protein [Sulfitobacter sp. M22]MCF7726673.1 cyclase family protein [Sulfitobacter sp. M22]